MDSNLKDDMLETSTRLRKTAQYLMPSRLPEQPDVTDGYNIYPVFSLGADKIFSGYASLTQWMIGEKNIVIDGYGGVFWDQVQETINHFLAKEGLNANWFITSDYLKPVTEIDELVAPFLGTENAVWGTKCTLTLADMYQLDQLSAIKPDEQADLNIVLGTGAALANWDAPILYIDLPKNELQFRMRAGSINNLGAGELKESFKMYKRSYFVDWVLLNKHKKAILNKIVTVADGQWPDHINWMFKTDLSEGLGKMSRSVIRVRPWFEPGAWGGQWIKERIGQLNNDVVNYAWSFELIVPENGLVFESNGNLLEVSFDMLMFENQKQVLGKHADIFGDEFPVRFDFLDTYGGGNLSIQCHPRLNYIRENFGENITQDETYYILDCETNATVYLGFQEDIDPETFKAVLKHSEEKAEEIDITQYVQLHEAKKHDLFLIPNGTVHSAGKGSLVLEISATPYIFTFKMYDWVRLDLEGKPRPINIDHAFHNLDFNRKGEQVSKELISKPVVIEEAENWQVVHLPTHKDHFYDVYRLEFDGEIFRNTDDCCHIMMLVEGSAVSIETADGTKHTYAYAETFVVPAAAGSYTLTNLGEGRARVILAFLK
ncbi:class I mannose-6-phosphate isomerase [Pedobacter hartonius]|uniref:Mannose-6-phosphate isomerase, class I n=1 Tax=Pedobacter hartonius TaxID=425514 RepID=A0A1H4GSS1_9SPHI|nr:class I mannose-6-phosphate isomerase [Pedobacter hartonius]SEB11672.1 Mannose-6-phosphate isomerase, class I [Pedobacter hartonius]